MIKLAREAINYFEKYRREEISEDDLILKMQEMEPIVTELYLQSGNIPIPPEDCKDYDQASQNIFATIHDMFLYFSKRGLERWPKQNRDWLMQDTIKRFYNDMERIRFEESRIH